MLHHNLPATQPVYGFGLSEPLGGLRFNQPVAAATPPGETNRLFVVERPGRVMVITNLASPSISLCLDLTNSTESTYGESGMLGIAFHPGFATNRFFYLFRTTVTSALYDRVSRFEMLPDGSSAASTNSEQILINLLDRSNVHNAGDLQFGPDGYLYISFGFDAPAAEDHSELGSTIDKAFFGTILRIDVDKKPGNLVPNPHKAISTNYFIPADNPFVGSDSYAGQPVDPSKVRGEIYALGFRNPWRFGIDPLTGALVAGDVGEGNLEEIDLVLPGAHYGYPFFEAEFPAEGQPQPPAGLKISPPLWSYSHGLTTTNQGKAVIGGVFYHGTNLPRLNGRYVFGDNLSGHVWMVDPFAKSPTPEWIVSESGLSAFTLHPATGNPLLLNVYSGTIKELVYLDPADSINLPKILSQVGAFSDLPTKTPADGLMPYFINVPFWSDYAIKTRWFAVPEPVAGPIVFQENEPWKFPNGTLWVKHFDLPLIRGDPSSAIPVETRFLLKTESGAYGLTYRWGGSTNEAVLVPPAGMDEEFSIRAGTGEVKQVWHYPGWGECTHCHNQPAGIALGFNTAQLNREAVCPGGACNQLERWVAAGALTPLPKETARLRRLVAADDESWPVQDRARSFLAANCSSCHGPKDLEIANWDARYHIPLAQASLVNAPLSSRLTDDTRRVIAPGSLTNSQVFNFLNSTSSIRMPPFGGNEPNPSGLLIISKWIDALEIGEWGSTQTGPAGRDGSATIKSGIATLGAVGLGIRDEGDALHFLSRQVDETAEISARVGEVVDRSGKTSYGLMLRSSTNALAPMVFLGMVDGRLRLVQRSVAATNDLHRLEEFSGSFSFLRLKRSGRSIQAAVSVDGVNWSSAGQASLLDDGPMLAGLAASSGDDDFTSTCRFDHVAIATMQLEGPAERQILLPAELNVKVRAQIEGVADPRLEILLDDVPFATLSSAPFDFGLGKLLAGNHLARVRLLSEHTPILELPPISVEVREPDSHFYFKSATVSQDGKWEGIYGALGHALPGESSTIPEWLDFDFAADSLELRPSDHSFREYTLRFEGQGNCSIELWDASSGAKFAAQPISLAGGTVFATWSLRGDVRFVVVSESGGSAGITGIFVDELRPPTIVSSGLSAGDRVQLPTSFTVVPVIESPSQPVALVELLSGGQVVASSDSPPFRLVWPAPLAGKVQVSVRVTGSFESFVASPPVQVEFALPRAAVEFVSRDESTTGNWIGRFGSSGFAMPLIATILPPATEFTVNGDEYPWNYYEFADRVLQALSGTNRHATTWTGFDDLGLETTALDGRASRISLYFLDYNSPGLRSQRVDLIDPQSQQVLDSRVLQNFTNGVWLSWNISGKVQVDIKRLVDYDTVVGGAFWDAPANGYQRWSWQMPGNPVMPPDELPPGGDPDGDGVSNLLEYCLGTDPFSADYGIGVSAIKTGDSVEIQVRGRIVPAEASIQVQSSVDLQEWVDFAPVENLPDPTGEPDATRMLRLAASADGMRFYRLSAGLAR